MSHTLPDYTTKYKLAKIFGQIDVGELIARLTNIGTIDRRGNLFWYDDFEGTNLKWFKVEGGGGGAAVITDEVCFTGNHSAKITPVNVADAAVSLNIIMQQLTWKQLGFEVTFTYPVDVKQFRLAVQTTTLDYAFIAHAQIVNATNVLQIRNSAGGYTTVANDIIPYATYNNFHTLKLVIDLETGYYMRLIYDDVQYDVSAEALQTGAGSTSPYISIGLSTIAAGTGAFDLYIDNFILTQNEP
jgi:hypothetical protein